MDKNKLSFERCELLPIPDEQKNLLVVVFKDSEGSEYRYYPRWKDLGIIVKLAALVESSGMRNSKHLKNLRELERLFEFYQAK